jgi:hypothetical protein
MTLGQGVEASIRVPVRPLGGGDFLDVADRQIEAFSDKVSDRSTRLRQEADGNRSGSERQSGPRASKRTSELDEDRQVAMEPDAGTRSYTFGVSGAV